MGQANVRSHAFSFIGPNSNQTIRRLREPIGKLRTTFFMKRITYYFALVVVTGLASCSNSNDEYTSEQKQEIKVDTSIQGMLTRTDQNTSEINDNAFVMVQHFVYTLQTVQVEQSPTLQKQIILR